jgi:hypothetical protein
MPNPTVTLQEFYDRLERHDWYYEFSDDFNVWKRGDEEGDKLRRISYLSPAHKKLYDQFVSYKFESDPKPIKPSEEQA